MTHTPAPRVVQGNGPFRTPGSRLTWGTVDEWLQQAALLASRRISAQRHAQESAHLTELARRRGILDQANTRQLEVLRGFLGRSGYRPPRGMRAGTSWQAVLEHLNNTIYSREQLDREVLEHQREHAAAVLAEE